MSTTINDLQSILHKEATEIWFDEFTLADHVICAADQAREWERSNPELSRLRARDAAALRRMASREGGQVG